MKTKDYIREFFMIFFIRKTIILAIVALVLVGGVLLLVLSPPVYQAQGAFVLKGAQVLEDPTAVGEGAREQIDPVSEKDLFSEMEILSSYSVFERAAQALAADGRYGLRPGASDQIGQFAGRIQGNFSASIVPRSNVIRASLQWDDPADAETVLEYVFEGYRDQRQSVFNPKETRAFFRSQIESYQDELAVKEARLLEVADGRRLDELEKQIDANVDLISSLEGRLADLEGDRLEQRQEVQFLESTVNGGESTSFYTAIDNLTLGDFSQQVQGLYVQEAEVLQTYKPGTNKATAVQQQVGRMQGLLNEEALNLVRKERNTLVTLNEKIAMTRAKLDDLRASNRELNTLALKARQLERQIDITEGTMRTFDTRFQEARIKAQEDNLFKVGVVEAPQAGQAPVFPNPNTILPVALAIGLLLGLTAGFLLEFFDHRFRRPEDLHNFAGLPCIFSIPRYA